MVIRKLDGAVDKSSVDQEIFKSSVIVHYLWKIWRPVIVHYLWKIWRSAPSGTRSYGRQAGRQASN